MKNGVEIYGGFDPDNGITNLSHKRILPNAANTQGSLLDGQDLRPVIWNDFTAETELNNTAMLDGFTIMNGRAIDNSPPGGGMRLVYASPVLRNLVIRNNMGWQPIGGGIGGGIFMSKSAPIITNVVFQNNTATRGGGIFVDDCGFYGCGKTPVLTNVLFVRNEAIQKSGGAISSWNDVILNNVTTADNYGTAIWVVGGQYAKTITVNNSIIFGGIDGAYTAKNSFLDGYTDTQNGNIAGVDFKPAHLFTSPETGDYTLKSGAPVINKGDNLLNTTTTDPAGNTRSQNGTIDLGAYESSYATATPDANGIIYVKPEVSGNGSGDSWVNATDNLRGAVHLSGVQQVWVATGTYNFPTANIYFSGTTITTEIGSGLTMKNGVAIYGGFDPGNGIDDLTDQRILPNSAGSQGSFLNGTNAMGIVRNAFTSANPLNNTAILNGFTLTNGKTTLDGGAMYNEYASPTLKNLLVLANHANYGAGIFNRNSSPLIADVLIKGNVATTDGGGMYNDASSTPQITNATITGNTAKNGAGVMNRNSSPVITNSLIAKNTATTAGGGVYAQNSSALVLTNVTIADNTPDAFYADNSTVSLANTIVLGTTVGSTYTSQYSLIQGNTSTANGNLDATGITATALFTDAANGDYSLKTNAPVANKGNNTLYPGLAGNTKDLVGNPRVLDYTFEGVIDLGAYESAFVAPIAPDANGIVYVKENPAGNKTGSSWANATDKLQEAINAGSVQKVFVATGNYDVPSPNSFVMKNGVEIYGGFDPVNNITDLSHNRILPNHGISEGSVLNGKNERPVIWNYQNGVTATAVLDGFTIKNGYNTANSAGIMNNGTLPTLRNLLITQNSTTVSGAGILNNNASPIVTNVIIKANTAGNVAGGVANIGTSSPVFTNVLIAENTATSSSGVYHNGTGTPTFNNATIANNTPDAFTVGSGSVVLNNSIVYGGITGTYMPKYSLIEGNTDFTNGNIDATGISATAIFNNGNYTLKHGAVAANAGLNSLNSTLVDLAGNQRIMGMNIDLGAYECPYAPIAPDANNILYVDIHVVGGNQSGNSWVNAVPQLADALKYARLQYNANNTVYDVTPLKIYVAKGTYLPMYNATDNLYTTTTSAIAGYDEIDNAFVMVKNVQVYGGFDPANNIDDLTDTRIFGAGGSILSGDVGQTGTTFDNARHVVISSDNVGNAVLDGFTVTLAFSLTGANSASITVNGYPVDRNRGGMICVRSSPTITNCTFTNNVISFTGGGITNYQQSSPTITNCIFTQNSAENGGAIANVTGCLPIINNCSFIDNGASANGGAIYNTTSGSPATTASSPTIINCSFTDNASHDGGAIYNEKGSSAIITNALFANNQANGSTPPMTPNGNGSAIYNSGTSSPVLTNVTIADNLGANAYYSTGTGSSTFNNSIVFGTVSATYTAQYSLIEGNTDFTNGNLNPAGIATTDLFANPATGDYTLKNGAVAVNAGLNSLNSTLVDLAGTQRIMGTDIDLGAYEFQGDPSTLPVTLLNFTAKDDGNRAKLQWQTANEVNHKDFEIYRSSDDGVFVKIGEVPASHISRLTSQIYSFTDYSPQDGNNYYKLIQIDNNGKTTDLGIRTVNFNFPLSTLSLYPNPTGNQFTVAFKVGQFSQLEVTDLTGKVLQRIAINNTESSKQISIANYPAGLYLVRLSGNGKVESLKVIKK